MALFGGGKPDHPMADIKNAKSLIADLPTSDPVKVVEDVTMWLESIMREEGFKVDYRFMLFDLLDQAAKNHPRRLAQDYLATDRQEKFRESKLWNTSFEFWKMLGAAYIQCVEQFQAGASGSGGIKKDLAVIIARALRALTLQLKWGLLRYGPVDDRVWSDIGRLYLFGEAQKLTTTPIAIYPGQHGGGTIQQEFLKALMLSVSSTDGLAPLNQEIAERIVAHFGTEFVMAPQTGPGVTYCFDLAMRKPAARVMQNSEPSATTRFFGAGKAMAGLVQLALRVREQNAIPSDINLGGVYEPALVLGVMKHLTLYWSDKPPARSSERRKMATRMTVVHGFKDTVAKVDPTSQEDSLDFHQADGSESWIAENVSDGGFGAIIPQVKGDWLKVGCLIGVQTETSQYWGAGVVRRITRDEFQQRRVGIQMLSKSVIPVSLAPAGNVSSFSAARGAEAGILLSTSPDKNGEVAVLMRDGSFSQRQALDMTVRGKTYYLMPSKMVEGGDDYDHARFKIMKRE
jgi:hypothetical protein